MNLPACFLIECIITDGKNISNELFEQLKELIEKRFDKSDVKITSLNKYWKYPDTKQIIFEVRAKNFISVEEFTKLFNITWKHSKLPVSNYDTKKTVDQESAVWNRNMYPEETFLNSDVEWVHVYSWLD